MTTDEMILHTAYFPSVSWFSILWSQPTIVLEACEHYQKGSTRNRCHIAGPNGEQRLSIPLVKGKHQQTPIREVRIAYEEPWQRQHWRSIKTAYGNAPFFEHYADGLAPFFERRHTFLFDLNFEVLQFLIQKTGWRGEVLFSEKYEGSHSEGVTQSHPLTTPPSSQPTNPSQSTTSNFKLQTSNFTYPQVFEEKTGFLPNLSMLDLLLCCGKQSSEILAPTTSTNRHIHIA